MTFEEQRPLLDRADEEEGEDSNSNNDVTGAEEMVESIIQNYVCFTLFNTELARPPRLLPGVGHAGWQHV